MVARSQIWYVAQLWAYVMYLFCIFAVTAQEVGNEKPSVAIIGAGIGGSSASFFLRELVGEELEIEVFEQADKPGGRADVSATRMRYS